LEAPFYNVGMIKQLVSLFFMKILTRFELANPRFSNQNFAKSTLG